MDKLSKIALINSISIVFCILFILSCNNKRDRIDIPVSKTNLGLIAFDESYTTFPFYFVHNDYEKYYQRLMLEYKNMPSADTLFFIVSHFDTKKFIYSLHNEKFLGKDVFADLSNRYSIDTVVEAEKASFSKLIGITGLKNSKQFIIIDENGDKDFSNDSLVFFNNTAPELGLDKLPSIKYDQKFYLRTIVETHDRNISVFPRSDYYAFQRVNDTLAKKLGVVGVFKDHWKGEITVDDIVYDIVILGFHSRYLKILIKDSRQKFSMSDEIYNDNFAYNVKDTIELSNTFYLLDSIDHGIEHLYLKKIRIRDNTLKDKGHRIGEIINDYRLEDMNDKNVHIKDRLEKSYTLLYFWGTWCSPCKETTPKIKKLHTESAQKLNVLGIAYRDSKDNVKKYAQENELSWTQTIIEQNNEIIKELNIRGFPTLVLLDETGRIVYRGGPNSTEEIKKIINIEK